MQLVTSEQLERLDIGALGAITEQCQFHYQLTSGELKWLAWIGDRYAIGEYLCENITEAGIATIDVWEVSNALSVDGVDRAPCLSVDTQLQRLIWLIGPREDLIF